MAEQRDRPHGNANFVVEFGSGASRSGRSGFAEVVFAPFTIAPRAPVGRGAASAAEAIDGEPVRAGRIYLAPGGKHMTVVKRKNQPAISLNEGPLVNFCRPAVDPLFASAAQVWGSVILAVILTGMGSDGTRGAEDIVAAGGSVIAQDEATSVVWGMPGTAAHAGVCAAVLPLDQIGPKIVRQFGGMS